jgi:hypothetical protein
MLNMMTTVGNSIAPLTPMGRFISTIGLVCGLSVLAMLLNAMVQAMSLNPFEKRTFDTIQRQKQRIRSYSKAATLIEAAWLRYRAYTRCKWHVNRLGAIAHFSRMQHRFREHRKTTSRLEQLQSEHDILGANIEHAVDLKIRALREEVTTRLDRIEYAVLHAGSLKGYAPAKAPPPRGMKLKMVRGGGGGGGRPAPVNGEKTVSASSNESVGGSPYGNLRRTNSDPPMASPQLVARDIRRRKTEKISQEALRGMALSAEEAVLVEQSLLANMTPQTPHETLAERKRERQKSKPTSHWLTGGAVPGLTKSPVEGKRQIKEEEEEKSMETNPDPRYFRNIVVEMYSKHNPTKLDGVDDLLGKYTGREQILLEKLAKKYGCAIPTGKPAPADEEEETF